MHLNRPLLLGIALCTTLGLLAKLLLTNYLPLGSVTIAIIAGALLGNLTSLTKQYKPGIDWSASKLLAVAIALMGVNLDYAVLRGLGVQSLLLIVVGVGFTLSMALLFGKLTTWDPTLILLIAIGNGICGTSAITATKDVIGASEEEVGLSVAVVNFLGTLGIFLVPFLGVSLFGFSESMAGVLVGNTLQAVGQVTAGGFSINDTAGQTATVVKLGRVLMLTPVIFLLAFRGGDGQSAEINTNPLTRIPNFVFGFVLFSLVATFGLLPQNMLSGLSTISSYALVIAMAGLGLKITFAAILQGGRTALLAGTLIFAAQIGFTSTILWLLF